MKTLQRLTLLCLTLLVLSACSKAEQGTHLLQGTIQLSSYTDIALNYSPTGCTLVAQPVYLEPDSLTGQYSIDIDLARDAAPYQLLVGEKIFGVYLEKGKSLTLNISEKDGQYVLDFDGDNAKLAEFTSEMYKSFDIMLYSPMDPSAQLPIDECFALLDQNKAHLEGLLSTIDDAERRAYMAEEIEYQYISMKLLLYGDRADQEEKKESDYPEVAQLLAKVDPNSPHALSSDVIFRWLFNNVKAESEVKGDLSGVCLEAMDLIEQQITNPDTRQLLTGYLPQYFFSYGDHTTGVDAFWTRYCTFAKDYPDLIKAFEAEKDKEVKNMDGQALPDITLTATDGTTLPLSSILPAAKITYVDIWATWCGPCCKEIPYLESLVEAMKGNPDVQFVSISVDSDLDAWHKKLDADKPQWQQFVLDDDNNKLLSEALNITGIPRFLILDAQGKVIDQDARRPSDPELLSILDALARGK